MEFFAAINEFSGANNRITTECVRAVKKAESGRLSALGTPPANAEPRAEIAPGRSLFAAPGAKLWVERQGASRELTVDRNSGLTAPADSSRIS